MLQVAQISFFRDPERRTPAQILRDWWPLVLGAEMIARAGASVTVIQACEHGARITQNGITYHFIVPDGRPASIVHARDFTTAVREIAPDLFHVHGLGFPADVLALKRFAPDVPLVLQDHADRVPRLWRRRTLRRALSAATGISFCATRQAQPFREAGLIARRTRIFEISEISSPFSPGEQIAARRAVNVFGDPAVLWVGHLDENKDPLTILKGIGKAARQLADLRLWCCFGSAALLPEVSALLEADPVLAERVHLLGKVDHAKIQLLMQAADLFVLGSHREGSGVAVIEALACGLPPVISDIPSFRMLTGNGCVGALWPCGDADKLCEAILAQAARPRFANREAVRAHFERELSPAAVGRQFVAAYELTVTQTAALQARA